MVRDAELRKVKAGDVEVSAVSFTIAWNDKRGERELTLFKRCKAWRQTAEFICKYLGTKGSEMILEGREVTEKWTDQNGAEKSFDVLYVDHAHFCGKKQDSAQTQPAQAQQSTPTGFVPVGDDSDLPF
jgi:single-strand DNA-binding protein